MKRVLASLVLLLACAMSAFATDITVSSHTVNNYQYTDAAPKVRVYNSTGFLSSTGEWVPASAVGSANFYKVISCTANLTTDVLSIPSFVLPSTVNGSPSTARFTLVLFTGSTKRETIYSNLRMPISYGTTITVAQWITDNQVVPTTPRPGFPDTQQVQTLINAAVNTAVNTAVAAVDPATRLRETSGPTTLTIGAVADGEFLARVGSTIVGSAAGGGGGTVASVFGRTGVVSAATNDYTWAQVDKSTSSLADLLTRSAGDLNSGTLLDARLSSNVPQKNAVNVFTNVNTFGTDVTISGILSTGTAPTVLTDSAGKILSAALNTVQVAQGGTGTSTQFTLGSVVVAGASGVYTQDNAGLFYADATNQLGINTATPRTTVDALNTGGTQLRLSYTDNSVYSDFTVGSGGTLTVAPTGNFNFNTTGKQIDPVTNYSEKFGQLSKKYLTGHFAELWAETLVAQNTIATIGGRILVGPTSPLIADLSPAATTINVKYNNLASGDRVYMEANNSVEFMAVTSGSSVITGGFSYSVTRNLDGTGANQWYAGDAVFNTGTTGSGFIDLYSVRGVNSASEAGPTIVGNIRNSSTYNDWSEHWAIGNLNGLYGYGADTPGIGLGEYEAGKAHVTIDSTNGYRVFSGLSTVIGQWSAAGVITVGQVASGQSNILISSGVLQLRNNTTVRSQLNTDGSGYFANSLFAFDTSGNVTISGNATIAGWTINSTSISSGTTYLASGFNIPAGQVAWFGRGAAGYQGMVLTDATNRTISAAVGVGVRYPYFQMTDGTRDRVIIGGLNDGTGDSLNSMGMRIWNSAGTKLVEFSDSLNMISGWTIGQTKISSTGIDLHSGASAALAFGTTPPTSATVGTGIWLDRTGMYGLASSVLQAKLNAVTGTIIAGAGDVVLDVDGLTLRADNTVKTSNIIKWFDTAGSTTTGFIRTRRSSVTTTQTQQVTSPDATGSAVLNLTAVNNSSAGGVVRIVSYGSSHASLPSKFHVDIGAIDGMVIGSNSGLVPVTSAILELNSTVGAFLPPRLTTTQRDALTPTNGMMIYNSTTGAMNYYKAGVWTAF